MYLKLNMMIISKSLENGQIGWYGYYFIKNLFYGENQQYKRMKTPEEFLDQI